MFTDNAKHVVSKRFITLCAFPGKTYLMTTANELRKNGQAEQFYKTMVAVLVHYVAERQLDWDIYAQLLTYAYTA